MPRPTKSYTNEASGFHVHLCHQRSMRVAQLGDGKDPALGHSDGEEPNSFPARTSGISGTGYHLRHTPGTSSEGSEMSWSHVPANSITSEEKFDAACLVTRCHPNVSTQGTGSSPCRLESFWSRQAPRRGYVTKS